MSLTSRWSYRCLGGPGGTGKRVFVQLATPRAASVGKGQLAGRLHQGTCPFLFLFRRTLGGQNLSEEAGRFGGRVFSAVGEG